MATSDTVPETKESCAYYRGIASIPRHLGTSGTSSTPQASRRRARNAPHLKITAPFLMFTFRSSLTYRMGTACLRPALYRMKFMLRIELRAAENRNKTGDAGNDRQGDSVSTSLQLFEASDDGHKNQSRQPALPACSTSSNSRMTAAVLIPLSGPTYHDTPHPVSGPN